MKKIYLSISILFSGFLVNAQWSPIFVPGTATPTDVLATASLDDFSFLDDNNGIVSLGYVYYMTTDGGTTWSDWKDFWPYPAMYATHYQSANSVLVGGAGKVYQSTDGGTTFSEVANPVSDIRAMDFNGNFGVLADHYCAAAYTTDGGANWTTVPNTLLCGNLSTMYNVEVVSSTKAIISGANSHAFITTDAGANWSPFSINSSSDIGSISFLNAQNGVATAAGELYKTTDGGTTWTSINTAFTAAGATGGYVECCFVNSTTIYATAGNKIYKSTDGGATFSLDYTNTDCTACYFIELSVAGNSLFAGVSNGGAQNKIYKTGVSSGTASVQGQELTTFNVYPNPATTEIVFQGLEEQTDVEVYNTSMQLIGKYSLNNLESIDVSGFSTGMYFVKANQTVTKFNKL
jgi:photosystem II stability/assembly factor-like uncharacterized protein